MSRLLWLGRPDRARYFPHTALTQYNASPRLSRTTWEDTSLQETYGLDDPLVFFLREFLQLRLPRELGCFGRPTFLQLSYTRGARKSWLSYYLQGEQPFDLPGISCFLRRGDEVYHTY